MLKKQMIIFYMILVILIIILPFCIEKILITESVFPFDKTIAFSKESWFGFIASYLGAIGTVCLGGIALYQNKKYKELSDQSDDRFLKLQEDIKELTQKNVDLIEINTKIEKAKFYPILSDQHHVFWDVKDIENYFSMEKDNFLVTHNSWNLNKKRRSIDYIFKNYHTFTCTFKNESERTIRNFCCSDVITNNQEFEMKSIFISSCDIEPGTLLRCVYATENNLPEEAMSGKIGSLSFTYKMNNGIGEQFKMQMDVLFTQDSELYPDNWIQVSPITVLE